MTRVLRLRPRAQADLDDIWEFTRDRWSEDQARNYFQSLSSTFDLILAHPEMARERHEFSPPVRIHTIRSHVVIFQANEEAIDVIRIVHARSNWAAVLSE